MCVCQSKTSASGTWRSSSRSVPGVCPISPILTSCQDDLKRITGFFLIAVALLFNCKILSSGKAKGTAEATAVFKNSRLGFSFDLLFSAILYFSDSINLTVKKVNSHSKKLTVNSKKVNGKQAC